MTNHIKPTKGRAVIILLLLTAVGVYLQPYRLGMVSGESMSPSLHNGQLLLIDRNYYKRHPLEHGDIVSCRVNGKAIVKRVYALPGEQVLQLHCDSDMAGDLIVSPYLLEKALSSFIERPSALRIMRIDIEPGCVYLLGDGGMLSVDSREFGPVPQNQILGKVVNGGAAGGPFSAAVIF